MFKSYCNTKSNVQTYECQVMYYFNGKLIAYDGCLWQELKYLWSNGIKTIGCCCGNHINSLPNSGYIQVADIYSKKMQELGYKSFINKFGVKLFKPKTIIESEV